MLLVGIIVACTYGSVGTLSGCYCDIPSSFILLEKLEKNGDI